MADQERPAFITAEMVEAAIDPDGKPGVIKIDGQPFPLIEFEEG